MTPMKKLKYCVVKRGIIHGEVVSSDVRVQTKAAAVQVAREEGAKGWLVEIYKFGADGKPQIVPVK